MMNKLIKILLILFMMNVHGIVQAQEVCDGSDCPTDGDENEQPVDEGSISVPEPSIYLLMLSGLIGFGVVRHLKKQS